MNTWANALSGHNVPRLNECETDAGDGTAMSAGGRLPGPPVPLHCWKGAGGVGIAADRWGDPAGRLVRLLHGGGQTRQAWKGTGQILGDAGYNAVAFDARGHGDSDWAAEGAYGPDAMVDDLCRVIEAAGDGRPPLLVGASLGGGPSLVATGEGRAAAAPH